jgi:hypothetical protein
MRTALLLSGNARFCAEFDMQLDALQNSDIDWYVVLWNRYHGDGSERNEWIPPSWRAKTAEEARAIIEPKLPPKHKLAYIELVDPSEFPPLTKQYKHIDCTVANLFQQYWMLKRCDHHRLISGIDYDLVIRSRPDIGIEPMLDLKEICSILVANPQCIVTPMNHRNPIFNDMFAIGLPDTIKTYCEAVDHIDHFNLDLNVQLHSEIMISSILAAHGLQWPNTNLRVSLRENGQGRNGDFKPNFGRWI